MKLNEILNIKHPIIMAPMFLVSDETMVKAALDSGITAAIPAMNYRTNTELRKAITNIKAHTSMPFGINLIVNKSNIYLKNQLQACLDLEVDFVITALGSPVKIMDACKKKNIKVFTDVINTYQAKKVEKLGVDAVIALNNRAGGHLGISPAEELIPMLKNEISIPVISAGGVANHRQFIEIMELGAAGVSVGSVFIASTEAPVNDSYKDAIVKYGEKDIIITKKLSGNPCTVINTPYFQQLGTKENFIERLMHLNPFFKKYIKLLIAKRGMSVLKKAAFNASYKTVWSAGVSIEEVKEILPIKEIIQKIIVDSEV